MSGHYYSDDQDPGFQEKRPPAQSAPSIDLQCAQLELERFLSSRVSPPSSLQQQAPYSPLHPPPLSIYPQDAFLYQSPQNIYRNERLQQHSSQQGSPPPPPPPPHHNVPGNFLGQGSSYTKSSSHATPGTADWREQVSNESSHLEHNSTDASPNEGDPKPPRSDPDCGSGINCSANDPYSRLSPYYLRAKRRPLPYSLQPKASVTEFNVAEMPSPPCSLISPSPLSFNHESLVDSPYRYPRNIDPNFGYFDPSSIEDDGDDGLEYRQRPMTSMPSSGNSDRNSLPATSAGSATKGSLSGSYGSVMGKKLFGQASNRTYDSVNDTHSLGTGANGKYTLDDPNAREKSEWLSKQSSGQSKLRQLILLILTILLVGTIAGGITGGILSKKKSSSSSSSLDDSGLTDLQNNGDLDRDSSEIKKLLNNPKLHKVFPALDYTPIRSQYPNCLEHPPSQNNITRDLAVLSQLSNTIRLYGTDCNQTQMLIHSIDKLGLKGQVKIWIGVWLDKNETTNSRQLDQMYDIFNNYGSDPFVGAVIGNEVLFRQDMTSTELGAILSNVRSNLTRMGITLPVASSDLGDDWTAQLATETDILMANIHPFFSGVSAEAAASWTWSFWQQHNVALQPNLAKNMISETGWPSAGGISCGGATTCTGGSVASIDAMNTFMDSWVCQALANGTNYFWFEAFDEPWKMRLNEPGKEWEDKWGLMDVDRNLKPGIIIPSCGGKTVG